MEKQYFESGGPLNQDTPIYLACFRKRKASSVLERKGKSAREPWLLFSFDLANVRNFGLPKGWSPRIT